MYSFNASLNFDREDNLRLMDELTRLQHKVNTLSGVTNIFPRVANAKTNLICQVREIIHFIIYLYTFFLKTCA